MYLVEEKVPRVSSRCTFTPRGDERNASVTLSLQTASKGSKHSRALTCPSSASFAKMTVGYVSSLWQTEHAVAVAVRLNDIVALSFRVKYDMIGS